MVFRDVFLNQQMIGWKLETEASVSFFGNRFATPDATLECLNIPKIHFLKQVHGSNIVMGPEETSCEADGHWTNQPNVALGIHTADCLPVMLECPVTKTVFALHAGWKGIEKKILSMALKKMSELGAKPKETRCFVGPHISKSTFEVGLDVATRLSMASPNATTFVLPHPSPEKKYIDLLSILKDQFEEGGGSVQNLHSVHRDTYSSQDFFSFRRDGKTGRLISLILLR